MAMTFKTDLMPDNTGGQKKLGSDIKQWEIYGTLNGTATYALGAPLSGITNATNIQAIEAINEITGLLKKTGENTWSLDSSNYIVKVSSSTAGTVLYYNDAIGTYGTSSNFTWDKTNNILTAPKLKGYIIAGQAENSVLGNYSTVEGQSNIASGLAAHAEGKENIASGTASHAEGNLTYASGYYAHSEGRSTSAVGTYSHAEGFNAIASGTASHAEGRDTIAEKTCSHAEGRDTSATGLYSHVEGFHNVASGTASHSQNRYTVASGLGAHAGGYYTVAQRRSQYVFGEYNVEDTGGTNTGTIGTYVEIIGNGSSDQARSNARTLKWNGDEWIAGKLTVSTTPTEAMDVATKGYVDNILAVNDAMVFKGTLGTGGTITTLPNIHEIGWTYKVITPGTYAGQSCEIGDMIICIANNTIAIDTDWAVVQTNIDGAVIGSTNASNEHIAVFDGTTGKVIKDSGFTIATSVPANAVFTDTTYIALESGSGNVVTSVTASNGIITVTKGNVSVSGYLPLTGGTLTGELTVSNGTGTTSIFASGYISGEKVYGAVWNDYAEYRNIVEPVQPGQCVREVGDDTLILSQERLERGCEIISDTFGFAIGQTENAKIPIAVSGRVLAYPYETREEFATHIGWPVCSGPNGTVSIMTEEEERKYPSRIIGTISAVPNYEEWGSGNIKVNGRIWIKIK